MFFMPLSISRTNRYQLQIYEKNLNICQKSSNFAKNFNQEMNILDIILAIPLGYCIWKGYKRGIVFETAALAGIIGGCWAAVRFAKVTTDFLELKGDGAILVAFFIIFVGVVVLSFFLGKCIQGFVKIVKIGVLDKLLGAVLGMAKCVCIISVFLSLIDIVDNQHHILKEETKDASLLYRPVEKTGKKLTHTLHYHVDKKRQQINK